MECYIHPKLPYSNIPEMIETQKTHLESNVQEMSKANIVYPGLELFQNDEKGRIELADIPGVTESGWTAASHSISYPNFKIQIEGKHLEPTDENLKSFQLYLLDKLSKEEISWPFLVPVSIKDVPDYLDLVKDPIDISTIRKSVEYGHKYISMDIFIADVRRIFKNAKIYNGQESVYYKNAQKLLTAFNQMLNDNILYDLQDITSKQS